jgi:hypothetical protein
MAEAGARTRVIPDAPTARAGAPSGSMRPIRYSLEFRGSAVELAPRVLRVRATAPVAPFVTALGECEPVRRSEPRGADEAILESRLMLGDDGALDAAGTMTVGYGDLLRFRTVGTGRLTRSPDPELRQGTLVCEVEDGEGQFEGARGRIASNFVLSETGELTDNHLGLVFLADRRDGRR